MPGGYSQYMSRIRLTSVTRPYGICPVRKCDFAVWAKIDDYLYISEETMHMPRLVIHRVGSKSYALETDRSHVFLF
jgi:hypothetical protein